MLRSKAFLSNTEEKKVTDEELAFLKKVLLDVLSDINFACKQESLDYFLFFGSLLGAKRHGGFIPWDDDVDLIMLPNDISKLCKALTDYFPGKYWFSGLGLDGFGDPFAGAKINLCGTSMVELVSSGYPFERGINIDVFPIRKVPSNPLLRKLNGKFYSLISHVRALAYENSYPPLVSRNSDEKIKKYFRKRRNIGFFCRLFSEKFTFRICKKMIFRKKGGALAVGMTFGTKGARFSNEDFWPANEALFEGVSLKVPKETDKILVSLYGEKFMELPPLEKRETHSLVKIAFGEKDA